MVVRGEFETHLLILLLGQIHEDLASGVLNVQKTEDSSAVIGHRDILKIVSSGESSI